MTPWLAIFHILTIQRPKNRVPDPPGNPKIPLIPRGKNHGGKSTLGQKRLRNKIIRITTQEKPSSETHWTTRSLAKRVNTTHSFVHRVWQSVGLKPHLFNTFKVSNDPPVGKSAFATYEGLPSDYYLRLVGKATRMVRKEIPLSPKPAVK